MAGSDDSGTAWATSYDARVGEVLGAVNDLILALENYGGVITQAGYNHAIAEHNATAGAGAPPVKPPDPVSVAGVLSAPPSAGGPGKGLIDNAIGLADQVGIPVPDGDTEKIDKAAQAWDRLATVYQTKTVVEALEVNARAFSDTQSVEVDYIARDLRELKDATSGILEACAELSQSCRDYKSALDELRNDIGEILEDLAVELGATAAIGVAASFVTFGVGAVAATAKGVQKVADVAKVRQKLERIKNLGRRGKGDEPKPPPPKPDSSLEFNSRPERLDHTFAPKHNLDGVVERTGGREEAIREMLNGLRGNVPHNGTFETVIEVSGEQVTVRGFVDNGTIKIGTAFIP